MKLSVLIKLSCAASVAAMVSVCLPAHATSAVESDLFQVTWNGNPYELSIPETYDEQVVVIPTIDTGNGAVPIPGDSSMFDKPTVWLDPDYSISDVFGVIQDSGSPTGYDFAFISDNDTDSLVIPSQFFDIYNNLIPVVLPEPSGFVSVQNYIASGYGYTDARFISAPDGGVTVAMLGLASLGMAYIRRKLA